MKRTLHQFLTICLTLAAVLAVSASASAKSVEIRLKDGSKWRGAIADVVEVTVLEQRIEVSYTGTLETVEDLYIIIDSDLAGRAGSKTIFRDDIISMRSVDGGSAAPDASRKTDRSKDRTRTVAADAPKTHDGKSTLGVFLLPLDGGVGETLRHEEIDMMTKHADSYGPGQIIVLKIRSNGGLVYEAEMINESIAEMRKNHRVVAWVDKAISAGCSTAMSCDEIYFFTHGVCGSVTTIRGMTSVSEEDAKKGIEHLVKMAKDMGRSEHVARSMKLNKYECSYDKDPITGEVTWYGDTSGEFVLSTDKDNLCFNASNAEHCGFSDGTADTEEDLAKLLDLPRWHLIDDYGQRISRDWHRTYERAETEIPRLKARLNYENSGLGDPVAIINTRIRILKDLRRWWDRSEVVGMMLVGIPPDQLDRQIEELQKQAADLRRRRR